MAKKKIRKKSESSETSKISTDNNQNASIYDPRTIKRIINETRMQQNGRKMNEEIEVTEEMLEEYEKSNNKSAFPIRVGFEYGIRQFKKEFDEVERYLKAQERLGNIRRKENSNYDENKLENMIGDDLSGREESKGYNGECERRRIKRRKK